ncbi:MAG: hypothetical protein J6K19_02490 [Prevotella sp.]|nr:hypothetical protein [Prevotella sp.]
MKRYIKPEAVIVEMELQPMMAASEIGVKDTEVDTDMGKNHGGSHSFDLWAEDEE